MGPGNVHNYTSRQPFASPFWPQVVRRVDSVIHRLLNRYPVESVVCFVRWIANFTVDTVIHPYEQAGPGG